MLTATLGLFAATVAVGAADPHSDMVLAEGISKFCEDLGVEPTDIVLVRGLRESQ